MKSYLRKKISVKRQKKLRIFYNNIRAIGKGGNLNRLAQIYGTDKYGEHYYTPHYMTHFDKLRFDRINLLEIGVGGYDDPLDGGQSLRMWKKYFPRAKINAIDIYDKSFHQARRIKIFQGSQVDESFLETVIGQIGQPDIIVDDGSHMNEHVMESFRILFPKLKPGGIYVVEDIQTSYWEDYGGSTDLSSKSTSMNFFKTLTDSVNSSEFKIPDYEFSYYDQNIASIHFYHNMVFVYKMV